MLKQRGYLQRGNKMKFEIGDRVCVYGRPGPDAGCWSGKVTSVDGGSCQAHWGKGIKVLSDYDSKEYVVHPKQCRKLKLRKNRQELWIEKSWLMYYISEKGSVRAAKPQEHAEDFLHVREVKK